MRRVIAIAGVCTLLFSFGGVGRVGAASTFASPAFQQQWQRGEALAPNFWGPLANAKDGQDEAYKEATGGKRKGQYFDKGRMELANGVVTNGLLATELIRGQIQTGDNTFESRPAPAIPIAGAPDNPGPTYAALGGKAKTLLDAAPAQVGNSTQAVVSAAGDLSVGTTSASGPTTFAVYDDATKHNVPKAFADYRTTAGLPTIGYARSEPFLTTVKIGGTPRSVMVQVFERRVLTYTMTNPAGYQVEMGNVGRHYYQWRYGSSNAVLPPVNPAPTTPVTTAAPTLNWSGYEVDTKNVTAIHAAWVVPAVAAPPATGYAATWVGIGGTTTNDLIQAGTEQDIEDGVTTYYAWVEALPDDSLGVSPRRLPANPGDLFSVTITNTSGNDWTVLLENRTTNQQLKLTTTYQSCKCSAEWIEEVPEVAGVSDPAIANFGAVTFTEATATVGGTVKNLADLGAAPLALRQHGKITAQPQTVGADHASFAVSYLR
ncbi:MAG: G1 family endopeptidase [Chloroflexota bacterium]|nr:G1 family endopeptidase [Chloroflexota bacterium]